MLEPGDGNQGRPSSQTRTRQRQRLAAITSGFRPRETVNPVAIGRLCDPVPAIGMPMKTRTERFSAEKLTAFRKAKNISQRDLAKLTGISQAQIAELERGRRQPTLDVAERMAIALDVGIAELSQP